MCWFGSGLGSECLGVALQMQTYNISSCLQYFCSGDEPVFKNQSLHYQLMTFCQYCDRPDLDDFLNEFNKNAQCKQYFYRNVSCPEGKCATEDICIDAHTVYNYLEDTNVTISVCYVESSNKFFYTHDFIHSVVIPFETRYSWIIKMVFQLVYLLLLVILIIVPNWIELIPHFIEKRDWKSFRKLVDMRMLSIYAIFIAQIPIIILGLWAAVRDRKNSFTLHRLFQYQVVP